MTKSLLGIDTDPSAAAAPYIQTTPAVSAAAPVDLYARAQQLVAGINGSGSFAARFLATVFITDFSPTPSRAESESIWFGNSITVRQKPSYVFSAATRGTGVDLNTGTVPVTVNLQSVNAAGNLSQAVTANVVSADANFTILGFGGFTPDVGYQQYQIVSTNPGVDLNPSTASAFFPITDLGGVYCFVAGTRILTERGEVAVEDLVAGDRVPTVGDDTPKAIVWIGAATIDVTRHRSPDAVRPVRIRAHAFAQNVPSRDLLVSPDHAVFVDGVLIPARLLINGGSVVQDAGIDHPHYFHIELENHAVVLAEGLAVETYLDTGNRAALDARSGVVLLNADFGVGDMATYETSACARLAVDETTVLPVWSRLAARSAERGRPVMEIAGETDSSLVLVAGQGVVVPTVENGVFRFAIPAGASEVRLVSRRARPSDTRPWLDDRRVLGVMVAGLALMSEAGRTAIALDDAALAGGWWDVEQAGRWTAGDARIVLPAGSDGLVLEVTTIGAMLYPAATQVRIAA